jgi:hypothetical protein
MLLVLVPLGLLLLALLQAMTKRTPEHRGDQIGSAYRDAQTLIDHEAESFRSRLRQTTDTELGSLMAKGRRLQAFLEQEERALVDRNEYELLRTSRVRLQLARARMEWMQQERTQRDAARVASISAAQPAIVATPPSQSP